MDSGFDERLFIQGRGEHCFMKILNLDPEKERAFEKLREDGLRLHVPIMEQLWKLEVFDKDGSLVEIMHKRAESWVRSAYNMLFSIMATKGATGSGYGAGSLQMRRTNGTVNASSITTNDQSMSAVTNITDDAHASTGIRPTGGVDNFGIQVGSDSVAESFEQHALGALITNGTESGQLSYVAGEAPVMTYVAGTRTLSVEWRRFLNNNSDGNVLVREIGIVRAYYPFGATLQRIMLSRDRLPAEITVPPVGQLRVTYTFQITYPA